MYMFEIADLTQLKVSIKINGPLARVTDREPFMKSERVYHLGCVFLQKSKNLTVTNFQASKCIFENCLFIGVKFSNCKICGFIDCDFIGCDFELSQIDKCKFANSVFENNQLEGIILEGVTVWKDGKWIKITDKSHFEEILKSLGQID
jgi:uncharacterized protein YjbI with pentapeptide repeats